MPRILSFTSGPEDWKALLADPEKHWKVGYSARTLAHCWESCEGFPAEVQAALAAADEPLLAGLSPLLAVPEFKVPLPGGDRASQNDIFVLARSIKGPVVMMVEGKVDEPFGPTLDEWRIDASPGKEERLKHLLSKTGLDSAPGAVRYQLLHRAASAVITAEQYRAFAALLLIHTFTRRDSGWTDYEAFLRLYRVAAVKNCVQQLTSASPVPLFAAWVPGNFAFLER